MSVALANSNATGAQSSGSVSSAAGLAKTFANATSNGNLVGILAIGAGTGATPTFSILDTFGNAWTEEITIVDTPHLTRASIFCSGSLLGGASHQITVKPSGTAFVSFGIIELSGADTTTPKDGTNSAGPTSGTAVSTGSIAVANSGEAILAVMTHNGSTTTLAENGSYADIYTNTNAANMPISAQYHLPVSAAEAATWTAGAVVPWLCCGLSIKAAPGGGFTWQPLVCAPDQFFDRHVNSVSY